MYFFKSNTNELPKYIQDNEIQSTDEQPDENFKESLYYALYNERYHYNEYHSKEKIEYKLNKHNFRCTQDFSSYDSSKFNIFCLGCSYTFGIGIDNDSTWSQVLHLNTKILPQDAVMWNLGIPGASNDQICRLLVDIYFLYKPSLVYIQWTIPSRREHVFDDGTTRKILGSHPKYWIDNTPEYKAYNTLQNDFLDLYNFQKNKLLSELLAFSNKSVFIDADISEFNNSLKARDGLHPDKEDHKKFAKLMYDKLVDAVCFDSDKEKRKAEFLL